MKILFNMHESEISVIIYSSHLMIIATSFKNLYIRLFLYKYINKFNIFKVLIQEK
jgi:hypothetical protein